MGVRQSIFCNALDCSCRTLSILQGVKNVSKDFVRGAMDRSMWTIEESGALGTGEDGVCVRRQDGIGEKGKAGWIV